MTLPYRTSPPPSPTVPQKRRVPRVAIAIVVALWAGAAIAGMGFLLAYQQRAGSALVGPQTWPNESVVQRSSTVPTLVMVVHPKCSCSRASMAELAKLMTRLPGKVSAHVLFVKPDGVEDDWEKTDLLQSARRIDGVSVQVDAGGVESRRFGTLTSGQVYLYGTNGALLFTGGITAARGHHGDNAGSDLVSQIVTGASNGRSDTLATKVFGCEIQDPPGSKK
jgi:hypothetical protein